MTWWLPLPGEVAKPCDAVMAFGLGSQKLYVIRSLKLVAVRQTNNPWDGLNFSDDVFLDRLLAPPNPQDDCPPAEAAGLLVVRAGVGPRLRLGAGERRRDRQHGAARRVRAVVGDAARLLRPAAARDDGGAGLGGGGAGRGRRRGRGDHVLPGARAGQVRERGP